MLNVSKSQIVRGLWRIFPAIEVPFTDAIPTDYPGPMGVPISFLDKYDPRQFELVGLIRPKIGERAIYDRILVRHLNPALPEVMDLDDLVSRLLPDYRVELTYYADGNSDKLLDPDRMTIKLVSVEEEIPEKKNRQLEFDF